MDLELTDGSVNLESRTSNSSNLSWRTKAAAVKLNLRLWPFMQGTTTSGNKDRSVTAVESNRRKK